MTLAIASANAASPPPAPSLVGDAANSVAALPGAIERLPLLQQLTEVMPMADIIIGGGLLVLLLTLHAVGVRIVSSHVRRRTRQLVLRPSGWRIDLLMFGAVAMLLSLHLLEMFLWSAALVYGGLVPDWRTAGFFAGNTYTTVGYGAIPLPLQWQMLAPIIAVSGLFTFGWSTGVLVDIVSRCQQLKEDGHIASVPPDAPAAAERVT